MKTSTIQDNLKKQSKVSLTGLTKLSAVIVATSSVAPLLDDYLWYLELFTHFKLQYFLASGLLCVFFLFLKEWKYASAMIIVLGLNMVHIAPWYVDAKSIEPSEHLATIKLVHSNVQTQNSNYQALIDLVIEESPDIFVAQEVNKQWLKQLSKVENILPYNQVRTREDNFGIALFSKYPLDIAEFIYFGETTVPSLKVSFTVAQRQISLITSHPLPPITKAYFESRNSQIIAVSDESKEIENPLIVIGDFNVTMWSKSYATLEERAGLFNTRKGFGLLPTWPTNLLPLMIPIDHCLVSSDFDVLDLQVGRDIGSDHLPLMIILGLKNKGS
jgi:endonuclease/exonuclease/phosphatase (EEP) superfamily protein YafD